MWLRGWRWLRVPPRAQKSRQAPWSPGKDLRMLDSCQTPLTVEARELSGAGVPWVRLAKGARTAQWPWEAAAAAATSA